MSAQEPKPPTFEVSSVKPNASGPLALQRVNIAPGERVTITNVPLLVIIQATYRLDESHIVGAPDWASRDRYDITAKADAPSSPDQLRLMLRTLLADRFRLTVHTEARNEPMYALVFARRDRRPGPKLRLGTTGCGALRAAARGAPPGSNPCGFLSRPGTMAMRGEDMDTVAGMLGRFAGRTVVNKTGFSGFVDYELQFTPQGFLQQTFDRERFPNIDPDGPSIFTAVQEQLGLKLESQKGQGDVLVIDRVERPSED